MWIIPIARIRPSSGSPYEVQVFGATPKESNNGSTAAWSNTRMAVAESRERDRGFHRVPRPECPRARIAKVAALRPWKTSPLSRQRAGDEHAVVSGHALVKENAIVKDNAKVRDWAIRQQQRGGLRQRAGAGARQPKWRHGDRPGRGQGLRDRLERRHHFGLRHAGWRIHGRTQHEQRGGIRAPAVCRRAGRLGAGHAHEFFAG